jgi:hypothetical protein
LLRHDTSRTSVGQAHAAGALPVGTISAPTVASIAGIDDTIVIAGRIAT